MHLQPTKARSRASPHRPAGACSLCMGESNMSKRTLLLAGAAACALLGTPAFAQDGNAAPGDIDVNADAPTEAAAGAYPENVIIITARRREETAQEVPLAIATLDGRTINDTGAFSVQKIQQLAPTLQVYSSNRAQHRGQHPRHRRAVRPDQRRLRAGRRHLRRRRLLLAPGFGGVRLPRRRPGRSAARAARHALRQEHHRGRDQHPHQPADLRLRRQRRGLGRQLRLQAGQGGDLGPAVGAPWRRASRSR